MTTYDDPLPAPENPQRRPDWPLCPKVRRAHVEALERMLDIVQTVEYAGHDTDFGVLTVGGGRYWPGIVVACEMLRATGYDGPIEVWHGHRANTEPADYRDVRHLGVALVDALAVAQTTRPRTLRGWEAKWHAIRHCRFRRLLYLDADAYCVADPQPMVEQTLSVAPLAIWQDLPANEGTVRWGNLGLDGQATHSIQGGQYFLDRQEAWAYTLLVDWLCQHSDYYFAHGYGDQDMMRIAWAAMQQRVHRLGHAHWVYPAFVCSVNGQPVVVHRCRSKLVLPSDYVHFPTNQLAGPNYALPSEREVWERFSAWCRAHQQDDAQVTFGAVWRSGIWGPGCGPDSDPHSRGSEYVQRVVALLTAAGAQRVVDAGCGDTRILQALARACPTARFHGVDATDCVFPPLDSLPGNCTVTTGDIRLVEALPAGDVLLAKDVLMHWPTEAIRQWLRAVKASRKWRLLVVTQDCQQQQDDTHLGGYRGLDPARAPLAEFGPWAVLPYHHKAMCVRRLD